MTHVEPPSRQPATGSKGAKAPGIVPERSFAPKSATFTPPTARPGVPIGASRFSSTLNAR